MDKRIVHELDVVYTFQQHLKKKGHYTVDELLSMYREKKEDGKLFGYTQKLAKELERKGQYRTAGAYRTVVRGLIRYNKNEDIPLQQINGCLIKNFEKHLRGQGKMPNTVAYYIRDLRAIYNKAVALKRLIPSRGGGEHPFAGISTSVSKTRKRALRNEEIQALYGISFEKLYAEISSESRNYIYLKNLQRAWRYFFFSFRPGDVFHRPRVSRQ